MAGAAVAAAIGIAVTTGRAGKIRTWLAVVAAYVTVLHLVLGGGVPVRAAPFNPGTVLCAHDGAGERPASPSRRDGHHANDCCLSACAMGAGLPASPPALAIVRHSLAVRVASSPAIRLDARPHLDARRIRGPPGPA